MRCDASDSYDRSASSHLISFHFTGLHRIPSHLISSHRIAYDTDTEFLARSSSFVRQLLEKKPKLIHSVHASMEDGPLE